MIARALAGPAAALRQLAAAIERRVNRTPAWVGPTAFLVITAIAIGVAIYGTFLADPGIRVHRFDAGPVHDFAIREVRAFPELDLYIVGLDDGRLRAIDGRVPASGCSVQWRPEDRRGGARNPGGMPGAYVDPCGGGVWDMLGDDLIGNAPLRTPQVTYHPEADGENHVFVEMINHPAFP